MEQTSGVGKKFAFRTTWLLLVGQELHLLPKHLGKALPGHGGGSPLACSLWGLRRSAPKPGPAAPGAVRMQRWTLL